VAGLQALRAKSQFAGAADWHDVRHLAWWCKPDSVAANLHQWELRNRPQRRGVVIDHT
jgi:hypothetical protein